MQGLPAGWVAILLALSAPLFAEVSVVPRIAVFEADVTPPLGTPLCDALVPPASEIVDRLTARGIVLLSSEKPIVLCAVDWVGIGNGGYNEFRERLAKAAGTTSERVAVHALHPHDTPGCDFTADEILAPLGLGNRLFDARFARQAMQATADAVAKSLSSARPLTHVGYGKGKVERVASARRVMGPDGKVKAIRWSSTTDAAVRNEPEGTIDPFVHLVAFYSGDKPVTTLTYYATHPQSHYGKGGVTCDFPGLARGIRDVEQPDVFHVHFNGAGGNVTAGKYNDGAPENRPQLAQRLAAGMQAAWDSVQKYAIGNADLRWSVRSVALPAAPHLDVTRLKETLLNEQADTLQRLRTARDLVWKLRCDAAETIDITCLHAGPLAVLHMPGELFVEYQLAAQEMRPGLPTAMAAYGDYGPGYIGQQISYSQGGYETGPVSRVGPGVEGVLLEAMREVLK